MTPMNELLLGASGMASIVAGACFARFWRKTRDRLFLFFSASFVLEGLNRFMMAMFAAQAADAPFYVIRLVSFLLILVAIVEKNWSVPGRGRSGEDPP
jgi:hypothetical protein